MPASASSTIVCLSVWIGKIDESVWTLPSRLGREVQECWLTGGSESQLLGVSNIGVIVCAKRPGCDFCSTHSCGSSSLHTGQMGLWFEQVHPGQ